VGLAEKSGVWPGNFAGQLAHLSVVRCAAVRETISAAMDGDGPPVAREHIDAHLGSCASCRRWQELAHVVTRRTRLGGPLPPPELGDQLMTVLLEDARRRKTRRHWIAVARAVAGAGLLQLMATAPLLLLARNHTSGSDRVHVLGLVELAIGAGFFLGALVVLWRERDQSVLSATRWDEAARGAGRDPAAGVSEVA
jgi:Putative zinc-finger